MIYRHTSRTRRSTRRFLKLLLASALCVASAGCASLSYYGQSVAGQLDILGRRQPIDELLAAPQTADALRTSLELVQRLLDFAHDELQLPDNGSYRSYAGLDRRYVVWNVFASPELSMRALQSCFPFTGCLSYRGYFSEDAAREWGEGLKERGFDVFVGGVVAYSTLGWFEDPVLSTMLNRDEPDLAKLLFHELAHQKLYVEGDTEFNEAFADAVALIGLRKWYTDRERAELDNFQRRQSAEERFYDLVLEFKGRLEALYESELDHDAKRSGKRALIEELRTRYADLKQRDPALSDYDSWFSGDLNNARLLAVSTYRRLVPAFVNLYDDTGGDLGDWYARVEALAALSRQDRHARLLEGDPRG